MNKLIDHLQKKKLRITLDRDSLGEQLYSQLWDEVREVGAAAANEAVAGWMQGVADGRPDLCVSFAHLEDNPAASPLTIVYSVGARDGSRMELRRIDLDKFLLEEVRFDNDSDAALDRRRRRAKTMAAQLRQLADRVDSELGRLTSNSGD